MNESDLKRKFREIIRPDLSLVLVPNPPGRGSEDGRPDHILHWGAFCVYLEFKRKGETLRTPQTSWAKAKNKRAGVPTVLVTEASCNKIVIRSWRDAVQDLFITRGMDLNKIKEYMLHEAYYSWEQLDCSSLRWSLHHKKD